VREEADPLEHIADPPTQRRGVETLDRRASKRTCPRSGSSSRLIIFIAVVLPDPDVPTTAMKPPASTVVLHKQLRWVDTSVLENALRAALLKGWGIRTALKRARPLSAKRIRV